MGECDKPISTLKDLASFMDVYTLRHSQTGG